MAISPEDFVKRLDSISGYKGSAYGRLRSLLALEEMHQRAILQIKGYRALSDAFKCFFLETVELVNVECRPKIKIPLSQFYGLFMPRLAHNFQSLCAAERVAIRGYPLHGYTLLRNTFDNIVLTSAALQKFTDFYSIEGLAPGKTADLNTVRKLRKNTEATVRLKMTGNQSGLSPETLEELVIWDSLFDLETHGARLSLTQAQGWMKGDEALPILPQFNERTSAMFINRYCEVAWMTHRLLPLMQPSSVPLPESWRKKWKVIDDSFEICVYSLTQQLDKKIGAAIVEFVKTKFPFNDQSAFPL
ncbi:MAG: hypothetical protein WBM28_05630 [Burkholderiales bacterium]